jgi:hypothetical protein
MITTHATPLGNAIASKLDPAVRPEAPLSPIAGPVWRVGNPCRRIGRFMVPRAGRLEPPGLNRMPSSHP